MSRQLRTLANGSTACWGRRPHILKVQLMRCYIQCAAAPLHMFKNRLCCSCNTVPAAGYFKNRFGAVHPCHTGTFKPAKGVGSCSRCKGRTYASKAGQKTCSQVCPRGCRVNAAHTACISYPPGTQPGPGNARRPCPAGELPGPPCIPVQELFSWLLGANPVVYE